MSDTHLRTVDVEWYRERLSGTLICVFAAFLLLLGRLYYLQIIRGAEFRRLSQNNCVRLYTIPPSRGLIFDRNGVLLVDNRPSFSVSIVLEDAGNSREVVAKLADFLGDDPEELLAKLENRRGGIPFKPILLKRDISRNVVGVIEAHKLDLPGIVITTEPMRHYIEGKLACHLIGYLGEISEKELNSGGFPHNKRGDFVGKFGVEKTYESYFQGKPGTRKVQVNALGQVTRILETRGAVAGKNVYLTLDLQLQRRTEKLLAEKAGAAVAMDPSNGHILAMASSPAFNPNRFVEGMTFKAWNTLVTNKFHPMENKAVQGRYPPGSTYKIVSAIAGLEERIIAEDVRHHCPGYYRYGDRTFRCWKYGGHGSLNIVSALTQSCDVFFFKVGEELGVDRLARYAKACGLGMPTGVDFGNEATGLVPTSSWKLRTKGEAWQGGETLSIAIGQGFNLVTPIQMVSLVAAVANGGTRYKPLVVKKVEGAHGVPAQPLMPKPLGNLPVSEDTLKVIRKGLVNVVNHRNGTGQIARIENIKVAGKTGTAQVVTMNHDHDRDSEDTPFHLRDHSWFVAFAPANDPRIAVAVLIEHGGHGAEMAGPIARDMIKTYLVN